MKRILKYLLIAALGLLFVWTLWFLYQKNAKKEPEYNTVKPKTATIVK